MLISIDVGFANCGWIVIHDGDVKDYGVIKTEKTQKKGTRVSDDHAFRSMVLAKGLEGIIQEYNIGGIIGELPSGGAQSARAMAFMMSGISVVATVACLFDLPVEWCTPNDVKKALAGDRKASKDKMMELASRRLGFEMVNKRFTKMDHAFSKGEFEHIADAFGAYLALKNDNLVKMFG